jgi:hypothetical protein
MGAPRSADHAAQTGRLQLNKLSAISFLYLCYSVLYVGSKVFEPFPETRDFE